MATYNQMMNSVGNGQPMESAADLASKSLAVKNDPFNGRHGLDAAGLYEESLEAARKTRERINKQLAENGFSETEIAEYNLDVDKSIIRRQEALRKYELSEVTKGALDKSQFDSEHTFNEWARTFDVEEQAQAAEFNNSNSTIEQSADALNSQLDSDLKANIARINKAYDMGLGDEYSGREFGMTVSREDAIRMAKEEIETKRKTELDKLNAGKAISSAVVAKGRIERAGGLIDVTRKLHMNEFNMGKQMGLSDEVAFARASKITKDLNRKYVKSLIDAERFDEAQAIMDRISGPFATTVYEEDSNGNYKLDEDGRRIPVVNAHDPSLALFFDPFETADMQKDVNSAKAAYDARMKTIAHNEEVAMANAEKVAKAQAKNESLSRLSQISATYDIMKAAENLSLEDVQKGMRAIESFMAPGNDSQVMTLARDLHSKFAALPKEHNGMYVQAEVEAGKMSSPVDFADKVKAYENMQTDAALYRFFGSDGPDTVSKRVDRRKAAMLLITAGYEQRKFKPNDRIPGSDMTWDQKLDSLRKDHASENARERAEVYSKHITVAAQSNVQPYSLGRNMDRFGDAGKAIASRAEFDAANANPIASDNTVLSYMRPDGIPVMFKASALKQANAMMAEAQMRNLNPTPEFVHDMMFGKDGKGGFLAAAITKEMTVGFWKKRTGSYVADNLAVHAQRQIDSFYRSAGGDFRQFSGVISRMPVPTMNYERNERARKQTSSVK